MPGTDCNRYRAYTLCSLAVWTIVNSTSRSSRCDTLLHGGLRKPIRHTLPVCLVGQLLPDLGQVVLAVGLLDVRKEFGAFTGQMEAAPEQVARYLHLGRIDLGLRKHLATQQHGDFLGVALVVFRLAAVDGFHIQCMPEDNRISPSWLRIHTYMLRACRSMPQYALCCWV
jgi:hypothetical protein